MPAKRKYKRKYTRPYKRRNYGMSTSSLARTLQRLQNPTVAFGDTTTERYINYGPSNQQMMDNPEIHKQRTSEQNMNRAADNYYGPGSYWTNIGKWGARLGGAALGGLGGWTSGGLTGAAAGAEEGYKRGADISRALGWGAYNVGRGANDLIANAGHNGSAPVYHSMSAHDEMGDVIISNRELVKLVKSSDVTGKFKVESFTLNPSDTTFHHLQQQSAQYEQFEFLGLMFQFIPMTGEGGTNELGVIGMATNYDPAQVRTFSSIEEMMRFKGATTSKPSVGMLHGIECDPSKRSIKTMYCRDGITRDASFTDPATFYFASEGISGVDQTLGQLWVTYSVKLRNIKPTNIFLPSLDIVKFESNTNQIYNGISAGVEPRSSGTVVASPGTATNKVQLDWVSGIVKDRIFKITFRMSESAVVNTVGELSFESLVNLDFVPMNEVNGVGGKEDYFKVTKVGTEDTAVSIAYVKIITTGLATNLQLVASTAFKVLGIDFVCTTERVQDDTDLFITL